MRFHTCTENNLLKWESFQSENNFILKLTLLGHYHIHNSVATRCLPFCAREACAPAYRLVAARACALKGVATCINNSALLGLFNLVKIISGSYYPIILFNTLKNSKYTLLQRRPGPASVTLSAIHCIQYTLSSHLAQCTREQSYLAYNAIMYYKYFFQFLVEYNSFKVLEIFRDCMQDTFVRALGLNYEFRYCKQENRSSRARLAELAREQRCLAYIIITRLLVRNQIEWIYFRVA